MNIRRKNESKLILEMPACNLTPKNELIYEEGAPSSGISSRP